MTSWTPDRDPILCLQYEAFSNLLVAEIKSVSIARRLPNSTPVRTIAAEAAALVGHATMVARSSQLSALTVIRTTGRWAADW